ncbi:MFS transporter [Pararobbsia alpina]|uniref:4-hydroxybenzoate transporter PcaK n=1 Tax=Pararobbsia alpina TaxID=621374 RepID=A0A6S7BAS3_9BURK|nr:MFS transporter [Pararobbsia alpina]CAB3793841.1 4-hydroxybenzoate transporter PcaK [Pararobbsia alpina]
MNNTVDVGKLIDDGPFTTLQKIAVFLAAMSIVLDGFDGQLIGYAIPGILKEWHLTRDAFAPAVAAGLIGMGIGSACAGLLADRFGRRWAVIASVMVFGAATSCVGFAPDVTTIALLRLVAGFGIGGALPSSTTTTAEFTPAKWRTFAVTATIVLYPLGGMLAGLYAGQILSTHGWRSLFFLGGLLPMAYGIMLIFAMPESPRFLVRRTARWQELRALLARMGRTVAADTTYVDAVEARQEQRSSFASLFKAGMARDTLAIWAAFFMCLIASYSAFSWLPTMLASAGLPASIAGSGLTAYNLGGVFGALGCAFAIARFGSRWPLTICCAGAALSAFAMQGLDATKAPGLLVLGFGVHGLFVNAVQSTMYALCTYVYPTRVRATGTAAALAFGRLGAVLSAFVGAAVITTGGPKAYLGMLAIAMLLVLVALAVVKNHIARRGRPEKIDLIDEAVQVEPR